MYPAPMQHFTLGFVFDQSLEHVLLMHKTKPEWQAGRVNGLGGKVEEGEESRACIAREIKEEADLSTAEEDWVHVGIMRGTGWQVDVYGLVYQGAMTDARSLEAECVEWFPVDTLPQNHIPNLAWIVPFVKNMLQKADRAAPFLVEYT